MSEHVKKATDKAALIFQATNECLNLDWDRKENLQFPKLLTFIVARLKADPKTASEIDPFMRSYVRDNPDYYVSRGAKGGIMLRSVANARLAKKAEIEDAKADLKAQIDAKVKSKAAAPAVPAVVVGDEVEENV